ncbi:MarR family winged helix-turn-helix transcriptional regulator [Companilactobacillus halodurans]|uniref:MarR family transcriptional regulator n=1 Tax=Companilactobacillus halodurans TaxID=2584183 RepID=A0A5P0ZXN7_9LACO|nr:MarR family transcriptional regulator [Companilactobacillus halodurans]MQS75687.1 MarR family transcriptional regulator [Companilactobacillus halodurans]MQS97665.1 MarR family transcriptional regulator [Companilactobacillus halodurans]
MSKITDDLMKQLRFISEAANFYMRQKKQKLTGQQRVLAILKLEDGLTQNYLAEVLDLRPSSLAELMKKMENNGDITRKEDENDKRSKLVFLTDAGRTKAEKNASLKNEDYSETFLAGLNDDEKRQFSDYLQKISDGWDDDFKKNSEKFIDPTDRYKAMRNMREQMMQMQDSMTPEEVRHMRHEMRRKMHHAPFGGPCMQDGRHPEKPMEHGHGHRPDFHKDFWRGPRF